MEELKIKSNGSHWAKGAEKLKNYIGGRIMDKRAKSYFILGTIIILISTPLGYSLVNIVYSNKNLAGEYIPILNGFIHSLMLIGILIFTIGIVTFIKDKK